MCVCVCVCDTHTHTQGGGRTEADGGEDCVDEVEGHNVLMIERRGLLALVRQQPFQPPRDLLVWVRGHLDGPQGAAG